MTESNHCCVHVFVSGRVQGVWFRAFTREQARLNQVTGWAKNLADGRVEVMLEGTPDQVNRVLDDLRKGPPMAVVTDLQQAPATPQQWADFTIA